MPQDGGVCGTDASRHRAVDGAFWGTAGTGWYSAGLMTEGEPDPQDDPARSGRAGSRLMGAHTHHCQ